MGENERKTERIQIRTTTVTRTVISNFCKDNQLGNVSEFMIRAALEKIERHKDTKTGDGLNLRWIEKDLAFINRKVAKERAEFEDFQEDVRKALIEIKNLCLNMNQNHPFKKEGSL
jgi:hypothetical protein